VRTLLDVHDPIETARCYDDVAIVQDERKIDQVVNELSTYKIDMAALQETRWFGEGIYKVGESFVLSSGRPVPVQGKARQQGEGVALVQSGPATIPWRDGGSLWKVWNSRACLKTSCIFSLCTNICCQ